MHASAACRLARKKSRAGSMNATFDSLTSLTHSSFKPFIPYPHSRHHRSTRTHVLLSLSPHTIRRRHAAASSCTSCVPHGRTTGPTSPGTALLCYSDVFCVCFVRPSAQGRLLLRVLRAFRLLRCVKLFYQLARTGNTSPPSWPATRGMSSTPWQWMSIPKSDPKGLT